MSEPMSVTTTSICSSLEQSCPSWFIKIMERHEEEENKEPQKPQEPRIPKVPPELRAGENNACYSPLVVSIGPHHYSDREVKLRDMEKLKAPMTRQFVNACSEINLEVLYKEVKQAAQKAKGFYTDELLKDFTDEAFEEMMFIDGCFVLQFIYCWYWGSENFEMTNQQILHVIRDLLLLENQLPFPVMESLMNLRKDFRGCIDLFLFLRIVRPKQEIPIWHWIIRLFTLLLMVALLPLTCLLCCFCREPFFRGTKKFQEAIAGPIFKPWCNEEKDKVSTAHLLELLHSKFIGGKSMPSQRTRGIYLYYSAKNLKRMGIHLRPSENDALTNIKFKTSIFSGTLELHPIIINESTKELLLKLVAYETSTGLDQHPVTSYICFMASLIKDAEDVEKLRSKGIITNYLQSDQEVVDIFSQMPKNLTPDPSAYNDVKKRINDQCMSVHKRWLAECQLKYFSSPCAFIALVAAALGLILTAISTYKTVFPPRRS